MTVPFILTPGVSTAVVLRNSLSGGVRAGVQTAAGVNSGSVVYGLVSAFGLAFALRRWPAGVDGASRVGRGIHGVAGRCARCTRPSAGSGATGR